jgi:hypothetical protein
MGVFEWLRVPMGLKGAGSHFQEQMSSLLQGYLYGWLEVYMDDILVYANTWDDYVQHIRTLFEVMRTNGITLNPAKCKLGLSKVEFVGHEIDETGTQFTAERTLRFLELKRPSNVVEMQMMLGMANYFRDHIREISTITKPLFDIAKGRGKDPLIWNEVASSAYDHLKEKVQNIPKLFFVNRNAPVFLYTDACNHGIGAYLYQLVDGVQQPIAFLSKALTGPQLRWSTHEQEAYAIYYALKKFEYLIGSIPFTLRTDHKNLVYLNTEGSPKVTRWKIAIQEFDFQLEHTPGVANPVADCQSRLCLIGEVQVPDLVCTMRTLARASVHTKEKVEVEIGTTTIYRPDCRDPRGVC